METLDGDNGLWDRGVRVPRDIVQFVKYNDAIRTGLAESVLHELPHQLEEYMRMKGIAPNQA